MPQPPLVIVVDDDPGMSRAMGRMIETAGMTPVLYRSAEAMLDGGRHDAACVVIDVHLPGMDGFQLYERLAARGDRAPVVFVSASEDAEQDARARAGHSVTFLAKPFSGLALLERLRSLLDEAA